MPLASETVPAQPAAPPLHANVRFARIVHTSPTKPPRYVDLGCPETGMYLGPEPHAEGPAGEMLGYVFTHSDTDPDLVAVADMVPIGEYQLGLGI